MPGLSGPLCHHFGSSGRPRSHLCHFLVDVWLNFGSIFVRAFPWPLLASLGLCWLLAASGGSWRLLAASGGSWRLLALLLPPGPPPASWPSSCLWPCIFPAEIDGWRTWADTCVQKTVLKMRPKSDSSKHTSLISWVLHLFPKSTVSLRKSKIR